MRPLNSLPLTPPILHIRWGFFFPAFTGRAKLGSLADLGWPSALTLWPGVNVICTGSFFFFFPLTIRIIDTVEIWFWLITFFFLQKLLFKCQWSQLLLFQKDWLSVCTKIIVSSGLMFLSLTGIYTLFYVNLQKDIDILFACYLIVGRKATTSQLKIHGDLQSSNN